MRAVAIQRFGGPEVLELRTLPVPSVGAFEVLIAVHTAGVGSWDPEMRAGWSPTGKTRFPLVLGSDGSGTIALVGGRARDFDIGERVYAYSFDNPKGGFYAQFVAVSAARVAAIPSPLDLEHAGAVPATGLTALQGIDDALEVDRGERSSTELRAAWERLPCSLPSCAAPGCSPSLREKTAWLWRNVWAPTLQSTAGAPIWPLPPPVLPRTAWTLFWP
jgi:D-arabinose 1-dehydrogenase-like Zn-dependent alcohol dehydrogenase